MSFEAPRDRETVELTTVSGFSLDRLARLELDRRAGNAPYVRTLGDAPEA